MNIKYFGIEKLKWVQILNCNMVDEHVKIEEALEGRKEELIERFEERDIPNWIYSPTSGETTKKRLEDGIERGSSIVGFRVYPEGGGDSFNSKKSPPRDIKSVLVDYIEYEKPTDEDRFIPPNQGYRFSMDLCVELNNMGEIEDMYIEAVYKN
jgi:hypothetical protein